MRKIVFMLLVLIASPALSECLSDSRGDTLRNNSGEIECFGGCEPAKTQLCERTPAQE
jgi:hypothetical protein